MHEPDPRLAGEAIQRLTGVAEHSIAVVLGSGWAPVAGALGDLRADVAFGEVPGLEEPTVAGQPGRLHSIDCAGIPTLVFLGRTHLYEGRGVGAVAMAVRAAAVAGCRTVVLTNASGGLHTDWPPGTPVLISDHINLTGASPLVGPRFVDLTDLYSLRLRAVCREVMPDLADGVYVQFPGPHFETPAEVRMAATMGGDMVGMSTALEAIAARAAGLEVLGISLIANPAAGVSDVALNHEEVLANTNAAAGVLGGLLAEVLPRIGRLDA